MRPPRFAVIPTNGRPCMFDAVEAISRQVDKVMVIDTSGSLMGGSFNDHIFHYPGKTGEVNISRWWNNGLNIVVRHIQQRIIAGTGVLDIPTKWDVAIINDDVIVPEGWFDAVSGKMREMRAAAACSGGSGMPVLHTHPGPVGLDTRMQGFAFIVAGELGLRANEDLKWYFTDDYMDWESRKLGGMVMVPGLHVQHLYPNGQMTPEIHAQTAVDAQTFVDLYGQRPW
jgi:hypothetical protein